MQNTEAVNGLTLAITHQEVKRLPANAIELLKNVGELVKISTVWNYKQRVIITEVSKVGTTDTEVQVPIISETKQLTNVFP